MTYNSILSPKSLRLVFFSALLTSVLIALNTTNWFLMWATLEINMISFIPLLFSPHSPSTWTGATEYFFPQAAGSLLILIATILTLHLPANAQLTNLFIFSAMLLKGGFAPFHHWFITVFSSLNSWLLCFMLSTWQKLVPVFLFSSILLPNSLPLILPLALLGASWGMLMAANQTNMQSFIAYSSVGNLGWFLSIAPASSSTALTFFLLYSLMLATMMALLSSSSPDSLQASPSLTPLSTPYKIALSLCLLSLAGFPPTTGFIMKIWILSSVATLSPSALWLISLPLMISLAAYARFIFYLLFSWPPETLLTPTTAWPLYWSPLALTASIHCSPLFMVLL